MDPGHPANSTASQGTDDHFIPEYPSSRNASNSNLQGASGKVIKKSSWFSVQDLHEHSMKAGSAACSPEANTPIS